MAVVVALHREEKEDSRNPIYLARAELGLSLLQAATALGTSPTKLEREELNPTGLYDVTQVRRTYQMFAARNEPNIGRNFLFGRLPLRVARDFLGLSVEQIAARYDVSPSHWRKLECHARELTIELRDAVEKDVSDEMAQICVG